MSSLRTLLFFISLIILPVALLSQEEAEGVAVPDSITYKEKYGLRVGIDLAKPVRTFLDDDYSGFEVVGDYRLLKNYFAAAEIGNEQSDYSESNLDATTTGSYIKLGVNYNAYNNWIGMTNEIFVGLRYGFATFKQDLNSYAIYTDTPYFEPDVVTEAIEYGGLTASWLEVQLGFKAELFNNLYLTAYVQLKRKSGEQVPENFDNLYVPGFGRTYDGSTFGAGFGYNISYLIPIFKKTKTQKNFAK